MCMPLSTLPSVNQPFCCCQLRCGAIIIGIIQLLMGAIDLHLQLYGHIIMIDIETSISSLREHKFYLKTYAFEYAACIIASFLGLVLLLGAVIKIPSFINFYRWTFWSLNVLFLTSIALVSCFVPVVGLLLFIVFLTNVYLLVCVNSFYLNLIEEKSVVQQDINFQPVVENSSNIELNL